MSFAIDDDMQESTSCDFTALSDLWFPSVDELCGKILTELGRNVSFERAFATLLKKVRKWLPCITDGYSALRYARFLLEQCRGTEARIEARARVNVLIQASLQELSCARMLEDGRPVDSLLCSCPGGLEHVSLLKAILSTGAPVHQALLLSQLGKSIYADAIVRDITRMQIGSWNQEETSQIIGNKLLDSCSDPDVRRVLLDIAAEHRLKMIESGQVADMLEGLDPNDQLFLPLLRYIGECSLRDLIPLLRDRLGNSDGMPLSTLLGFLDVLSQLGADLSSIHIPCSCPLLLEYVERASGSIPKSPSGGAGLRLAQCAFYGDIGLPGQAGGGGLATLLNSLGKTLARNRGVEAVYTLVLLHLQGAGNDNSSESPVSFHAISSQRRDPAHERAWSSNPGWSAAQGGNPLLEISDEGHMIVRVPVSFPPVDQARQFLLHEYEIFRAVHRALLLHGLEPDIFHVRYSDNASRAVMLLAQTLGRRIVFTITPDPHRNFSDTEGRIRPIREQEALFNLNKVFLADQIAREADGLVLIGHGGKNDQIAPYFPQLVLSRDPKKQIRVMPEGIELSVEYQTGESPFHYLKLLTDHPGAHRLEKRYLDNPMLVNVGRLSFEKGQHRLVKAWGASGLSRVYNLLLVGGNQENPEGEERALIERINTLMEHVVHLRGRFCHLGALPNRQVRLIERSIKETTTAGRPHVYVCSSFKEEFGISILEAMASGFLVMAPVRGGAGSYIQHGSNGFLIETRDSASLQKSMESILGEDGLSPNTLKQIAERGRSYAQEAFGIDKISDAFSDYYGKLFSR